MKSLISAFTFAAVMGIAAAASPASANTVDGLPNTCVVVNDGHHDFDELQCTHVYPFWYTPVRYKLEGGGDAQDGDQPYYTEKKHRDDYPKYPKDKKDKKDKKEKKEKEHKKDSKPPVRVILVK